MGVWYIRGRGGRLRLLRAQRGVPGHAGPGGRGRGGGLRRGQLGHGSAQAEALREADGQDPSGPRDVFLFERRGKVP